VAVRPGRIKADVPVDLGHPRHYTLKTSPEFSRLKAQLNESLHAILLTGRHRLRAGPGFEPGGRS
jgi:ABC-type nitrate/sulfonate/bicarbonate transport system ATPase subunit